MGLYFQKSARGLELSDPLLELVDPLLEPIDPLLEDVHVRHERLDNAEIRAREAAVVVPHHPRVEVPEHPVECSLAQVAGLGCWLAWIREHLFSRGKRVGT